MVRVFYSDSDFTSCERCGLRTEVIYRQDGFDGNTGKPRLRRFHRCPKAGWRHLWAHTSEEITYWGPLPTWDEK